MSDFVIVEGPLLGMGSVCDKILNDLPDWFGIEEANKNYVEKTEKLPTFVANLDSVPVGFMSLLVHCYVGIIRTRVIKKLVKFIEERL